MSHRITELTRYDIVDALLADKEQPFYGTFDFTSFLKKVWNLDLMPSHDSRFKTAEGDIWQHMVNNYDWDDDYLLKERLRISEIPDPQFARFLEACIEPAVVRSPERIEKLAALFSGYLEHDGFCMRECGRISGRSIYKVVNISTGGELADTYEVVLSFASEERAYVEEVANFLRGRGVALFYDEHEEAALWGKNLHEHFHQIYGGSARYCVMFISKHYAEKAWPIHERRSAFEKAIESREEYVLPARFDDTEIPGLHKTIKNVDLRDKTPEKLGILICKKLGRTELTNDHEMDSRSQSSAALESKDDEIPF
jgi:AbiJ-like protein/TIR domain-containing protein